MSIKSLISSDNGSCCAVALHTVTGLVPPYLRTIPNFSHQVHCNTLYQLEWCSQLQMLGSVTGVIGHPEQAADDIL
jgi:hypothetical protein